MEVHVYTLYTPSRRGQGKFYLFYRLQLPALTKVMVVAEHTYPVGSPAVSFSPVAFTHVSPEVAISKLCEDLMFGNSVWHCVYKNLRFIFGEE